MKVFFVLLALLIWGHAHAGQLYIFYEAECGDRIEYARTVSDQPRKNYLAYTFTLADGTMLLLETDTEGMVERDGLPQDYTNCNSPIDADIADQINTGGLQVFLLTRTEGGAYAQQPVMMASTIEQQGDVVTYRSPLTSFGFDTEGAVIGVDLDRGGEGASVYFDGREGNSCSSAYLFQQQHPSSAYPTINYKLLPQLGLLEREMLGAGNYSGGDLITATTVNGRPVTEYLASLCQANAEPEYTAVQQSFVPLYTEEPPVVPTSTATDASEVSYFPPAPAPAAPAPSETSHRVSQGETLYGIARLYGISVADLKQYNGLSTNTIYVGQSLAIAPTPTPQGNLVEAAELPSSPPVYETVRVSDDENTHVVQPGETVASLALRYGYTTARFREFNGLSDTDVAVVGAVLKASHCDCAGAAPRPQPSEPYLLAQQATVEPNAYAQTSLSDYGTQTEVEVYPPPRQTVQIVVPPARPISDPEVAAPPAYTPQVYGSEPEQLPSAGSEVGYPAGSRPVYVVKRGDNLFSIARRYGTTVTDLRSINGLLPADVIVPYQKLYVN